MMKIQNISNRTKKFKRKAFEFTILRPEMLGLQAVQKSNCVCVHMKPPSSVLRNKTYFKLIG
jgi:hypothetical protein